MAIIIEWLHDDDDDDMVNNGITIPYYNGNVDADDDIDYDEDRYDDGVVGSFILRHRGVQLILAYSWARPAILVAGKGRGGCFYFFRFFTFIPVPLSSLSLSFISSTISELKLARQ